MKSIHHIPNKTGGKLPVKIMLVVFSFVLLSIFASSAIYNTSSLLEEIRKDQFNNHSRIVNAIRAFEAADARVKQVSLVSSPLNLVKASRNVNVNNKQTGRKYPSKSRDKHPNGNTDSNNRDGGEVETHIPIEPKLEFAPEQNPKDSNNTFIVFGDYFLKAQKLKEYTEIMERYKDYSTDTLPLRDSSLGTMYKSATDTYLNKISPSYKKLIETTEKNAPVLRHIVQRDVLLVSTKLYNLLQYSNRKDSPNSTKWYYDSGYIFLSNKKNLIDFSKINLDITKKYSSASYIIYYDSLGKRYLSAVTEINQLHLGRWRDYPDRLSDFSDFFPDALDNGRRSEEVPSQFAPLSDFINFLSPEDRIFEYYFNSDGVTLLNLKGEVILEYKPNFTNGNTQENK